MSKNLWSDGKTESDICKMTDYGKSIFNLMEDIRCLKEDRNATLDEVIDAFDEWQKGDSPLDCEDLNNAINKLRSE